MTNRGLLIVFSGPSGVGKDTILNCFLADNKDFCLSISATTRTPRPLEINGRDYYFLSDAEFSSMIKEDKMLEYAQYAGNFYGTPRAEVERQLEAGKNVVLEIEVQGALQVKKRFPGAVFIFVLPPSLAMLRQRLEGRGTESSQCVDKRMDQAAKEISFAELYDYIIVNHTVEQCCKDLGSIVRAEFSKPSNMKNILSEVCSNA